MPYMKSFYKEAQRCVFHLPASLLKKAKKDYIVIVCNQMVICGIKILLNELIEFFGFLDFQLIPFNFYLMGSIEKKTWICHPDQ